MRYMCIISGESANVCFSRPIQASSCTHVQAVSPSALSSSSPLPSRLSTRRTGRKIVRRRKRRSTAKPDTLVGLGCLWSIVGPPFAHGHRCQLYLLNTVNTATALRSIWPLDCSGLQGCTLWTCTQAHQFGHSALTPAQLAWTRVQNTSYEGLRIIFYTDFGKKACLAYHRFCCFLLHFRCSYAHQSCSLPKQMWSYIRLHEYSFYVVFY